MVARRTLNFTDSDGIQHAIPAVRVNDIRLGKDNIPTVLLTGNESYQVASPSYLELVLSFQNLSDSSVAYL